MHEDQLDSDRRLSHDDNQNNQHQKGSSLINDQPLDLTILSGGFGRFHKHYAFTIMGTVWFFCGAHTILMSFATQEPPRFPQCGLKNNSLTNSNPFRVRPFNTTYGMHYGNSTDIENEQQVPIGPVQNASSESFEKLAAQSKLVCNPLIPLPTDDCTTPYFYHHPTATVVSEFNVVHAKCTHRLGLLSGVAWTSSAFFVGFLLGVALIGIFGDKTGRRKGIIASVLLMEVAAVLSGLTGSLEQYG